MPLIQLPALLLSILLAVFMLLFALTSWRENRIRPTIIGSILSAGAIAATATMAIWGLPHILATAYVGVVGVTILAFILPLGNPTAMTYGPIGKRVDERETMFAREEYAPGSSKYETYYREHPEQKQIDDRLRELPPLLSEGGRYYQPDKAARIKSTFDSIAEMTLQVDGEVAAKKLATEPTETTAEIKKLVLEMGAAEVGIARLNPMFVYSHVGRGPEPWGQPISLDHRFAVMFTLEMNFDRVQQAPDIPITEEAALQYHRGATLSIKLARHIRNLGYPARAHISDSNYQIMMPPVARDAGLGELSRMGYLISKKYGARVRLGGVTTDLPVIPDEPVALGVQVFCQTCLKCAVNCPSSAIPSGPKANVRGVMKWPLDFEKCLWYWRVAGTDCGVCMKVCPFSHPPTAVHNLVRRAIKYSPIARRLAIWGDDLFYGRKVKIPPADGASG